MLQVAFMKSSPATEAEPPFWTQIDVVLLLGVVADDDGGVLFHFVFVERADERADLATVGVAVERIGLGGGPF